MTAGFSIRIDADRARFLWGAGQTILAEVFGFTEPKVVVDMNADGDVMFSDSPRWWKVQQFHQLLGLGTPHFRSDTHE